MSTVEAVVLQQKGTTMKFLLLTLVSCVFISASPIDELESNPVASVLMNSSVLHKCNAFFYQRTTLLTTASCVSCQDCQYQITLAKNFLIGDDNVYDVLEVVIHPNYTQDPDRYNVAKLVIEEAPPNAVVFRPAKFYELIPRNDIFLTWRFDNNTVFKTEENSATYVSRDTYHKATGLYIRDYQIGVMTFSSLTTGPSDEGSPFFRRLSGEPVVLGFSARPRIQSPGKFFALTSIPYIFSTLSPSFFYGDGKLYK